MNRLAFALVLTASAAASFAPRAAACPSLMAETRCGPVAHGLQDDVDTLIAKFRKAKGASRDSLFEQLSDLVYTEELSILLGERRQAAAEALKKGKTLKKLEDLATERKEVDRLRKAALDIIEDDEKYFAPYRVPEVSAERAAEYRKVQEEIDDLTDQLREAWEGSKDRKLPKAFAAALEDFSWAHAKLVEIDRSTPIPEELPPWLAGLDLGRDAINVQAFGWNARELKQLRHSELVMEANVRRAAEQKKVRGAPEIRVPSAEEIEQVRITNAYRMMLGRTALAWNPNLQESAQGHSDYMSKTGDFSHSEKGPPERSTLGRRCELAGYEQGRGENIAAGAVPPEACHRAWIHSSGHHRNIVHATHTEMASGLAGRYWTQNFGGRRTPSDELLPAPKR